MSRDHDIEESRDFVGGVLSSYVTTLLCLGSIGLMELEIMTFVISVPIPIPMPRFTNGRLESFSLNTFMLMIGN